MNKIRAATRYFYSSFFGHVTVNDLQSSFTSLVNDQILSKIVQVSMDGPNVNLKFLDQLINQSEIQSVGYGIMSFARCPWCIPKWT